MFEFPRVIPSEAFADLLRALVPAILECTETEAEAWTLAQFDRDADGEFLMVFQNATDEVRVIHSRNPRWKRHVAGEIRKIMGEKDVAAAFPDTDFEDVGPADAGRS